jgi:phosphotransferase system IIB component
VPANSAAAVPLPPSSAPDRGDAGALLKALGGAANLAQVEARSTRLRIEVRDAAKVDEAALRSAGFRAIARAGTQCWHVVVGPTAASVATHLGGASR